MYTRIHEPIQVVGIFKDQSFHPKKFQWRTKVYPIDQVTLQSDVKNGGVRLRYYSVTSNQDVFRLVFNREQDDWVLEEIWTE